MTDMYSHDQVMKLLEVQRKSIMEFEAAKYELLMNSETEQVNETKPTARQPTKRAEKPRYKGPPRNFKYFGYNEWNSSTHEERRLHKEAGDEMMERRNAGGKGGVRVAMDIYNSKVNEINNLK